MNTTIEFMRFPIFKTNIHDSGETMKILKCFLEHIKREDIRYSIVSLTFNADKFIIHRGEVEIPFDKIRSIVKILDGQVVILQISCPDPYQILYESFECSPEFPYDMIDEYVKERRRNWDKNLTDIILKNFYRSRCMDLARFDMAYIKVAKTFRINKAIEYNLTEELVIEKVKDLYDRLTASEETEFLSGNIGLLGENILLNFENETSVPIDNVFMDCYVRDNFTVFLLIEPGLKNSNGSVLLLHFLSEEDIEKFLNCLYKRRRILTTRRAKVSGSKPKTTVFTSLL